MVEKIVAATALALCAVLLVRLALPEAARERFDAGLRRIRVAVAVGWVRLCGGRRRVDEEREAARLAEEAIRRARRAARSEGGKVVRPESFRRPRKPH